MRRRQKHEYASQNTAALTPLRMSNPHRWQSRSTRPVCHLRHGMRFAQSPGYTPGESVMSAVILNWWYTFRLMLQTNKIATAALEESWLQVRS
jgi:hypothetical protein